MPRAHGAHARLTVRHLRPAALPRVQVHARHRREGEDDGLRSLGQRQLVSVSLGLPAGDRIFPIYLVQLGGRDEDTCDDTALLFA